jgi:hypothetical protein
MTVLRDALKSDRKDFVIRRLAELGPKAKPAVPALEALKRNDRFVRREASKALRKIAPDRYKK